MKAVEGFMADRGELLEAALEVYPEGLALLDEQGRVVFWNHAAESATGYNRSSLVARQLPQALAALVSDPDNERVSGLRYGSYPAVAHLCTLSMREVPTSPSSRARLCCGTGWAHA